ncbi:hypothetical protein ACHWQZ_G012865 [Mnemiopsis leidyi]
MRKTDADGAGVEMRKTDGAGIEMRKTDGAVLEMRKTDGAGVEIKKTDGGGLNYRDKYYALRRTAKELIFENSAYQAEILECQKMIAQRERERELLLQHLLQYEQEAWELQSEMNNAHSEKHKLLKKQQEADKRKRVRLDTHLAEAAAMAQTESDGNVSKIPKIKIVFQHKGPGIPPSATPETKVQPGPAIDMNTEAKTAIKNKIKRNKLEPIVISLPSASMLSKDPLHQQTVKRPRPSNLGLNLSPSGLLAASRSGLILSPSLLSSQHGPLPFSPGVDLSEILARADHTPVDVFSESDTSSAPSSANLLHNHPLQDERLVPGVVPEEQYSMLTSYKRSPDVQHSSFRISPSALRSIKQKIDSINASQSPWKTKRSPSTGIPDPTKKSND